MEAWAWWLVAAGLLGIGGVFTAMVELGMFAVGALGAAAVGGLGGGLVLQAVVFSLVSVALLIFVRPIVYKQRTAGPDTRTGIDALKGRTAMVLERVDGSSSGRIKLAGEVWSARALEPGRVFEAGEQVDVADIDGATAVVM